MRPADRQQAWLRENGLAVADELATEFDDFHEDLGRSLGHGDAAPILTELDRLLERMSGEAGLWRTEALATESDWQRVREPATAALAVLPEHDR
ncbi:hypothetical protein [Amycolatopsis sp. MEPSY49]|uniref:hypothetical protein n=1 Tax=Amycolatopsis sp. MEPSY49 TaxID=3151600 RepID=UPI003EFA8B2F